MVFDLPLLFLFHFLGQKNSLCCYVTIFFVTRRSLALCLIDATVVAQLGVIKIPKANMNVGWDKLSIQLLLLQYAVAGKNRCQDNQIKQPLEYVPPVVMRRQLDLGNFFRFPLQLIGNEAHFCHGKANVVDLGDKK